MCQDTQPPYKISSKSLQQLMRICAYKECGQRNRQGDFCIPHPFVCQGYNNDAEAEND